MCMRTNIVLNEELVGQAMKYSQSKSKRAVVEEALGVYVTVKQAEAKRASYTDRLGQIRRKLAGVRIQESARDIVRRDRERVS